MSEKMPEVILDFGVRRIVHYRAMVVEDVWIRYPQNSEFSGWIFSVGELGWAVFGAGDWVTFYADNGKSVSAPESSFAIDVGNFVEPTYSLQTEFYQ
jgi:hypothetical protein